MGMCILSKTLKFFRMHRINDAVRSLQHIQLHVIDCGFSVASYTIETLCGDKVLPEDIKSGTEAISLGEIKRILLDYNVDSVGIRNYGLGFHEGSLYIVQKDGEHFICIEKVGRKYLVFDPVCGLYAEGKEDIHNYMISEIMLRVSISSDCKYWRNKYSYDRAEQLSCASPDLVISKIKSILG